ncbi:MAG: type III pantothenate kinase [Candidatus Omnitrophica bacterium]|nr:type III pantothenate kinase [Candidatus Omnitrophota bacterium]
MLLAIDIGNSNITLGVFKDKQLVKKSRIPTYDKALARKIKKAFARYKVGAILICSVVPKAEKALTGILKRIFKIKPLIMGKDIRVPIRNLYKRPEQVGQDRLINAYAGCVIYKAPLIIVDFGTAVTFDVVSKSGAYAGGIIAPGIELSLNSLAEKTALLPKITLKKIPAVLGKTTSESMASGIYYGCALLCDGLVKKLQNKFKYKFKVIATGGNARLIAKHSIAIRKVDEDLTLKGVKLAYLEKMKKI